MKIYYVSDNRASPNWGCRATSMALEEQLKNYGEISGILYNDIKKRRSIANAPLPATWLAYADAKVGRGRIGKYLLRRAPTIAARWDFVADDAADTAARIITQAKRFEEINAIVEGVRACDLVYVNGEGNVILTNKRRSLKFLLGVVALARHFGKKVIFGNSMISDDPVEARDALAFDQTKKYLSECSFVSARDPQSFEIATREMKLQNVQYAPDALFSWRRYVDEIDVSPSALGPLLLPFGEEKAFGTFNFSQPYIMVGGSSAIRKAKGRAAMDAVTAGYKDLLQKLSNLGLKMYFFESCEGDYFLRRISKDAGVPIVPVSTPIVIATLLLANARLMISGRYHPTIMGSLGGTPSINFGSNSHKMMSLQRVLGEDSPIEYGFPPSGRELDLIYNQAKKMIEEDGARRTTIKEKVRENADVFSDVLRAQMAGVL